MPDPLPDEYPDMPGVLAALFASLLDEEPRVALLSFSTHGSARHSDAEKVGEALALVRSRAPELAVDGELQADAALVASVAAKKVKAESAV